MLKHLICTIGIIGTFGSAYATWSSGGGELVKHTLNPWFIQNTKQVKYCIVADEQNMGQTSENLSRLVKESLFYWKNELKLSNQSSRVQIATQEFIETTCANLESATSTAEVVFQFGVLTAKQKKEVFNDNPQNFIGIAVRTDYDLVYMKGKGFIYVAPQSGPLKPSSRYYRNGVWAEDEGFYLAEVITHELGHVFGLGHFGESQSSLMAVNFAEDIVNSNSPMGMGHRGGIPHVLVPPKTGQSTDWCEHPELDIKLPASLRKEWNLIQQFNCLSFKETVKKQFDVHAYCDRKDNACSGLEPLFVGRITLGSESMDKQTLSTLYLPDAQRIFVFEPTKYIPAIFTANRKIGGSFLNQSTQKSKPILLESKVGLFDYFNVSISTDDMLVPDLLTIGFW